MRRKSGEKLYSECVVATFKRGSVMAQGYFVGETAGDSVQIKGIMKKKEPYNSIFKRQAVPSVQNNLKRKSLIKMIMTQTLL